MKNPKVIVLWGHSNSGKTTTINLVIDMLLKSGSKVISGSVAPNLKVDTVIKVDFNGKIIGIATEGDNEEAIKRGYSVLSTDCDIYIFSARSRGKTIRCLEKTFNNNLIVWHRKWCVSVTGGHLSGITALIDGANKEQADSIIDTIKLL